MSQEKSTISSLGNRILLKELESPGRKSIFGRQNRLRGREGSMNAEQLQKASGLEILFGQSSAELYTKAMN